MPFQWLQLSALAFIHFSIDLTGGMLPAILPVIRREFGLSLAAGFILLASLNLICNGVQLLTGHLREGSRRPLFLYLGIGLVSLLCLINLLPRTGVMSLPLLALLIVLGGTGIAMSHPEGLRAVHSLDRLPSSLTTVLFMVGGNVGFAGGAWVSSFLVSRWGLAGLLGLLLLPASGLALLYLLRIRLAVENEAAHVGEEETSPDGGVAAQPFWPLMLIAIPVTVASAIIPGFLPTRLHELGFPLTFGGLSSLLFGLSGAAGSLFWGFLARYRGERFTIAAALLLGVPFLFLYTGALTDKRAIILLAAAGFCVMAVYPLIVSMARQSQGPNLGRRMALIVGGAWGIASLVMMGLSPAAERWGIHPILNLAWIAYLAAALSIMAVSAARRRAEQKAFIA